MRALICTTAAAVCALTVVLFPDPAGAAFRAGDVGQTLQTPKGLMWIHGDSWNNGMFVRNAVVLNGKYMGTVNGVPRGNWVWLGAPWMLPDGRVAVFGSEMTQKSKGMFGFERVGNVYATFDPEKPREAQVRRLGPGSPWSAATARDEIGQLVYKIDADRRPMVGRPDAEGNVETLDTFRNAQISGQFSILQDPWGDWWMVGSYIMLSRKVVAYRLAGPAGPVQGKMITLTMLPKQPDKWYVYAATVHPELDGLLTYATNGKGPGGTYGLKRIENFWPGALAEALDKPLPEEPEQPSTSEENTEPATPTEPEPPQEPKDPEPPVQPEETKEPTKEPGSQLTSTPPLLVVAQTLCNGLHRVLFSKAPCVQVAASQKAIVKHKTHSKKQIKAKHKKKHARKHKKHRKHR